MQGLNARHFRIHVIRPTLQHLGLWSQSAEALLCGTAEHESGGLHYLDQVTASGIERLGPALGIFQIEPPTHADIFTNFLDFGRWRDLRDRLLSLRASKPAADHQLITNLAYATGVARLIYYRDPQALPDAEDLEGLGATYKRVYNTPKGAATADDWVRAYRRFLEREAPR